MKQGWQNDTRQGDTGRGEHTFTRHWLTAHWLPEREAGSGSGSSGGGREAREGAATDWDGMGWDVGSYEGTIPPTVMYYASRQAYTKANTQAYMMGRYRWTNKNKGRQGME
ncbi:hypothetical protein Pmani_016299 [Petrolisthes manimaculis]|uniref:Uncharacterized protein n=1 Tax=Petrolisthes manimaculis TaxID=1843537 RepID=A0AAE1PPD5_9EUCA|nr:hypothetical protein Pmani_016299 [Petrolisthes manimaculis]